MAWTREDYEMHGFRHIRCPKCGWSGMTDGDAPECGCFDEREIDSDRERCAVCGDHRDDCSCPGFGVETSYRKKQRRARRGHKDGKIHKGDVYVEWARFGYYEGGPRWLEAGKRLVCRAKTITATAALKK